MYRPWTTLMVQMFQEGPDNLKGKARIVNILGAGLSQEEVDLLNHVMSEQKNGVEDFLERGVVRQFPDGLED